MSLHHSVSKLCFGCEPLGGTDWGNYSISDVEDAVSRAVELGVNFLIPLECMVSVYLRNV